MLGRAGVRLHHTREEQGSSLAHSGPQCAQLASQALSRLLEREMPRNDVVSKGRKAGLCRGGWQETWQGQGQGQAQAARPPGF